MRDTNATNQQRFLPRRRTVKTAMNHPPQRAFTLIELLVVIAIIFDSGCLAVAVSRQGKKPRADDEETSAGRQLMLRRPDARGRSRWGDFPGYVTDTSAVDDQGQPLNFPENAR